MADVVFTEEGAAAFGEKLAAWAKTLSADERAVLAAIVGRALEAESGEVAGHGVVPNVGLRAEAQVGAGPKPSGAGILAPYIPILAIAKGAIDPSIR